jgi:hypothetical protein
MLHRLAGELARRPDAIERRASSPAKRESTVAPSERIALRAAVTIAQRERKG